jgi:hypothetical protein
LHFDGIAARALRAVTVLGATDAAKQLWITMGCVRSRAVLVVDALDTSTERGLAVQGGKDAVGVDRAA